MFSMISGRTVYSMDYCKGLMAADSGFVPPYRYVVNGVQVSYKDIMTSSAFSMRFTYMFKPNILCLPLMEKKATEFFQLRVRFPHGLSLFLPVYDQYYTIGDVKALLSQHNMHVDQLYCYHPSGSTEECKDDMPVTVQNPTLDVYDQAKFKEEIGDREDNYRLPPSVLSWVSALKFALHPQLGGEEFNLSHYIIDSVPSFAMLQPEGILVVSGGKFDHKFARDVCVPREKNGTAEIVQNAKMSYGRCEHLSVVVNGAVYFIGGSSNPYLSTWDKYLPKTNECKPVPGFDPKSAKSLIGAVVLNNQYIAAFRSKEKITSLKKN